jgi:hypothetical protein
MPTHRIPDPTRRTPPWFGLAIGFVSGFGGQSPMIRGEPKALERAEIERRQPVWAALSELWLDTELSEEDLGRISGVMRRSGYGLDELREIYLFEVAPVVSPNLLCLAGEWAGFDEGWLFAEATKRARKRSLVLRVLVWLGIGRWIMTFATERHWGRLVEMMDSGT